MFYHNISFNVYLLVCLFRKHTCYLYDAEKTVQHLKKKLLSSCTYGWMLYIFFYYKQYMYKTQQITK